MISVTVFVDSEHQYESIRMLGHAGLADDHQEGQELVFNFRFTDHISPESRLLMNSLVFGLQNIEEEYGEPYIKIRFEEV